MAQALRVREGRPRDELMTVAEMCAELGGVSRRTFYRWRELGVGPGWSRVPQNPER